MKAILPDIFKVHVITVSDRAHRGEYDDLSGPAVERLTAEAMTAAGWHCEVTRSIIPDERERLREMLTATPAAHLIITTGGTGLGPRDITVDVVQSLITRELPGIMELIRVKYGLGNPNALLSRAVAGVIDMTLIYTLPGSVKAVNEYMREIAATLKHTIQMLYGVDAH